MTHTPETHTRDLLAIEAEARRLRAAVARELIVGAGRRIAALLSLRRARALPAPGHNA